jgi:hypothetical protein
MEASTLIDPRVVEAVTAVVPVVAHGPLEHGTFETQEDGRPVTRCRLYRNLECSDHQATHEFLPPYQPKGRFRIPFTVWIDPDGKQLFRRDGWRRPEEFMLDIRLALEKLGGTHLSKAEYLALVKPLDEGRAALAANRYAEAAAKFEEAAKADALEVKASATEGLKEIRQVGDGILKAAKTALKSGRTGQARTGLDILARQFPTLECGREGLELVKALPLPLAELALREAAEPQGGSSVYLRGDGTIWVQVVGPKEGAAGLHERRYQSTLAGAGWDELAKLIDTARIAKPVGSSPATPEIRLWSGPEGIVASGPLVEWLKAQAARVAKGRPALEAPYDPAWRPEGFAR